MAQPLEIDHPITLIPLADLQTEGVVKRLIEENRTPFFLRSGETVVCFIPPGNSGSEQKLEVSLLDAKEIASIRDKLRREI